MTGDLGDRGQDTVAEVARCGLKPTPRIADPAFAGSRTARNR
ncbi:hypothetical protein [Streptosporangium sp. 'caverna']|nr:hypothetical protein [Streptosporangium sp. 'caverna']